ncbi:MAG: M23 family metallopeptidase [Prevotellaceae bacterium]|jgi:septal ring factor EnvC (AmiA/AmiB activator)|nr:M23 family metallopeptidase [Prevotellaceae bacterium]
MASKKTPDYISRLQSKYRLVIYNDKTYAEVWHLRLSRLNVLTFFSTIMLLVASIVVVLIAFTPLRELIPGYPNSQTRRDIVQNAQRLDSLQLTVQRWALYNDNLNRILLGEEPIDIEKASDTAIMRRYQNIMLATSSEESELRRQVEEMEQLALPLGSSPQPHSFASLHFFPPTQGGVVGRFNPSLQRFGIELPTVAGSITKAALDGTIISVQSTFEASYVITLQHDLNITTVYKNSGQPLKEVGDRVSAGEAIAIIGADKGSSTLAFEIWVNGFPVDPEQYIIF